MLTNDELLAEIDRHFLAAERLERVAAFQRAGRGLQGWFKGEMAYLVQSLAAEGKLRGWTGDAWLTEDRKKWADLKVDTADGPLWLEVRALHHRKHTGFGADMLSGMTDAIGVTDDVVRLLRAPDGQPMILLFVYPRPEPEGWASLMESYGQRIYPISVKEQGSVGDDPEELYVCKLAVEGAF